MTEVVEHLHSKQQGPEFNPYHYGRGRGGQTQWFALVILATWEVEIKGSWLEANSDPISTNSWVQ
jgi:hypothetical protein